MKDEGSGFDVVSGGELYRALKVGADPKKCVFAGVGKNDEEITYALEQGILLFNVESEEELANIDRIAGKLGKKAPVALRVNPDVDPQTHTYISTGKKETKFGVDLIRAKRILQSALDLKNINLNGLHVHIGSQITKVDPYVETMQRIAAFLPEVAKLGLKIEFLDIGGGFGIWYKDKLARPAKEIAASIVPMLQKMGCRILLEPGRFIVGNAGILVTRVLYVKESGEKKFVICDAGMNDLIRPTLYSAYHRIWPVKTDPGHTGEAPDEEAWSGPSAVTDIVGPICESGDFFAKCLRSRLMSSETHRRSSSRVSGNRWLTAWMNCIPGFRRYGFRRIQTTSFVASISNSGVTRASSVAMRLRRSTAVLTQRKYSS
jgi:diaminopimelate decarboxylase